MVFPTIEKTIREIVGNLGSILEYSKIVETVTTHGFHTSPPLAARVGDDLLY